MRNFMSLFVILKFEFNKHVKKNLQCGRLHGDHFFRSILLSVTAQPQKYIRLHVNNQLNSKLRLLKSKNMKFHKTFYHLKI